MERCCKYYSFFISFVVLSSFFLVFHSPSFHLIFRLFFCYLDRARESHDNWFVLLDALHKRKDNVAIFPGYKVGSNLKLGGAITYVGVDIGVYWITSSVGILSVLTHLGPIKESLVFDHLRRGCVDVPHVVVIEAKREDTFVSSELLHWVTSTNDNRCGSVIGRNEVDMVTAPWIR